MLLQGVPLAHLIISRYKTCMAFDNIPLKRVQDDAFWAMLLKLVVYPHKKNTPEKVYDLLLPFLVQAPLEAALAQTVDDPAIDWRTPQRAGMAYMRVILDTVHYLLRRKGFSVNKAKQVCTAWTECSSLTSFPGCFHHQGANAQHGFQ